MTTSAQVYLRGFCAFTALLLSRAQRPYVSGSGEFEFSPGNLSDLYEGEVERVNFSLSFKDESDLANFTILSLQPGLAYIINQTLLLDKNQGVATGSFWVKGKFLGHVVLQLESAEMTAEYYVAVKREFGKYQIVFTIVVSIMVTVTTFMMGTQVDWRIIVKVLKRPIAPCIGFCCQYGIMPVVAYFWGYVLLRDSPYLRLGYFAVGCCPGGKASNMWSILLDANLDLSITLTVLSNLTALAMMPLWLLTVGTRVIAKDVHVNIPFERMAVSLALLIIPTVFGMLLRHFRPKIAEFLGKYLKRAILVIVATMIIVSTVVNYYIYLLFTWRKVLAGMLLPWSGFGLAYIVSMFLRQNDRDVKTIAIETGIQNAGIAIIIITVSLAQPDADLTLVMPVICLLFTPIPLLFVFLYVQIKKFIIARKTKKSETETANVSVQAERSLELNSSQLSVSKMSESPLDPVGVIQPGVDNLAFENGTSAVTGTIKS